jgi:tetratricopeptide (TPR) repeat protein
VAACPNAEFRQGLLELAAEAVEKSNDPARARLQRAALYVVLNEFDKARADVEAVMALPSANYYPHYLNALLSLVLGDEPKYHRAVALMLERFSTTDEPMTAHFVAWAAVLSPGKPADTEKLLCLCNKAVQASPDSHQFLNGHGAVLYRAGRYQEAVDKLTELNQRWGDPREGGRHSPAYTWYFLAMAHYRLSHSEAATTWLRKADDWTDKVLADKNNAPSWNRQLTLELLRREAHSVIDPAATDH